MPDSFTQSRPGRGHAEMLRGALIGLGKIAQTGHLPAFGHPLIAGRAEIVAGADPKKESREISARQFPQLKLYEDASRMFEEEQIDFVDICATPQFHAELIESAVRRNIHILCEKPFALSLQEADRIARMLQNAGTGLSFMPCHQYRYSPLWRHFKEFLDTPGARAGCILQFNVFRTGADPGLHLNAQAWRTDRSVSGGGILADTGVHYLYLSLWMMGTPLRVTARTHQLAGARGTVEDTAIVILEYDTSIIEINLTWAADRRANSALLFSRQGSIVYDGSNATRSSGSTTGNLSVPDASNKAHYVGMYVDLFNEFIDSVERKLNASGWIREAYQSVQLLQACYKSSETQSTILIRPAT